MDRNACGPSEIRAGLRFKQLKLAHDRDSENGIRLLLSEKQANGKPRVTNRIRSIQKICECFEQK